MTENNGGVLIFPDADEFLKVMADLQEQYNQKKKESGVE